VLGHCGLGDRKGSSRQKPVPLTFKHSLPEVHFQNMWTKKTRANQSTQVHPKKSHENGGGDGMLATSGGQKNRPPHPAETAVVEGRGRGSPPPTLRVQSGGVTLERF